MYIIVIYDVEADRTQKFHKYLKKRVTWVQNSVFEGEISDAEYFQLKDQMRKMCRKEESVVIYTLFSSKYVNKVIIGDKRGKEPGNVI